MQVGSMVKARRAQVKAMGGIVSENYLRDTSSHFAVCAPHQAVLSFARHIKANSSGLAALIGTSPFPRRPHQNSFIFTTTHALLHRMWHNRIQWNLQYLAHIGWDSFLRAAELGARAIVLCKSYHVTVCWSISLELQVFITSREHKAVGGCMLYNQIQQLVVWR